ncbi:transposase [Streptomyces chartreusis]|uniref:transposase n=1 Tax=Streptomyces chartreusis TaxID=1969 RepID=UPI0038659F6A
MVHVTTWNPNPDARTGRHVACNLHVHLVSDTKYRRGAKFNGEADYVDLLVHYPPKIQLSKLVHSLKGVSARLLRKEHDSHIRRYLWGGHFSFRLVLRASCGGVPLTQGRCMKRMRPVRQARA